MERRHRMRVLLLVAGAVLASVRSGAAQQLMVGSVPLKIGEADVAFVRELSRNHKLQRIDGGWSIQPLGRDRTAPAIGVGTVDGRIQSVSFTWGPGFTPTAEVVAEQLAQALPEGAHCQVRNVMRRQEGGTVRTLEWLCGSYKVAFVTGVWSQGGNTATLSINRL